MTILNILIIYLACGSPFGVYHLTRVEGPRSAAEWCIAGASFVLWPIFLIKFVFERIVPHAVSAKERIEQIRSDLERSAFADGDTASLFEFREVFYRYAGLAVSASGNRTMDGPVGELIAISGRELDEPSSNCISRLNRKKVEYHLTQARNEFVDMIANMAKSERSGDEIVALGIELTNIIADPPATEDLAALGVDLSTPRSDTDRTLTEEVWKGHVKSAPNIS